jgi:hypothetical protein
MPMNMAATTAERVVRHLKRAGFAVMKGPSELSRCDRMGFWSALSTLRGLVAQV